MNSEEGDFLEDIKKEFQTILHSKDKSDPKYKESEEEKRKRIKEEIILRHEQKKGHREDFGQEEKAEITFVKEDFFEEQKLFEEEEKEKNSMKNYEQKNLFYPNEVHELSKALEVSIEKIQRAVELIHKEGIKGFGILEKELQVDSEMAERIYHRVKKLKEYR